MNAREARMSEAYGRARKAARLALACSMASPVVGEEAASPLRSLIERREFLLHAIKQADVREDLMRVCGYGHVSNETWEMVEEIIKEIPAKYAGQVKKS